MSAARNMRPAWHTLPSLTALLVVDWAVALPFSLAQARSLRSLTRAGSLVRYRCSLHIVPLTLMHARPVRVLRTWAKSRC